MNKRELARIALSEGDMEDRIDALLQLIKLPAYECKMPKGKLDLSKSCKYNHNGDCWLNIPDSVCTCKGVCSNFE